MEASTHSNRRRKRDADVVSGKSTSHRPTKSVTRADNWQAYNHIHKPQHIAAPMPQLTPGASFNISRLLEQFAGTDAGETPSSSSQMMAPNEHLKAPASPPQTDRGHYSQPYGATRGVQSRMVATKSPYSGVSSAILHPADPRTARFLSSTQHDSVSAMATVPLAAAVLPAAPAAAPAAARPMDPYVRIDRTRDPRIARGTNVLDDVICVRDERQKIENSVKREEVAEIIEISDDEAEQEAIVSSVEREEESARSIEVQLRQELFVVRRHSLDLEQKLLDMEQQLAVKEDMLQRERRARQEEKLRADDAEKVLKSQSALDDLRKRELLNVEQQLAIKDGMLQCERLATQEAELRAARAEKRLYSEGPLDNLKTYELEEKVSELTYELGKEKKRASERIADLTSQLEKERGRSDKSIDELKLKLAKYENSRQVQSPRIDDVAARHNIVRLLEPTAEHAISIDEAVDMVRTAFDRCGERAKKRCEDKSTTFNCDVCCIELHNKWDITTHFLSKRHIEKVRLHNASVSELAVRNWVTILN